MKAIKFIGLGALLALFSKVRAFSAAPTLKGRISSEFGPRIHPVTGEQGFHKGIDIAAPTGTPVRAPEDGEIILTVYGSATAGNFIVMRTDTDLKIRFLHLSKIDVVSGQRVEAGETIGEVGNTGISTGAHLHLDIQRVGSEEYINPRSFLGSYYG